MHFKLILFILLSGLQTMQAQVLVPYLGTNGLYGYADETGAVVIPPAFDRVTEAIVPEKKYTLCQKDGKDVVLLHNGLYFPASKISNRAVGAQNYNSGEASVLDSIEYLTAIRHGEKMRLVDLRNGYSTEYLDDINDKNPVWFVNKKKSAEKFTDPVHFVHNALAVWKSAGMMNFVDTNLQEIFPRDFAAGMVVDPTYFIVAEAKNKYALADRSGKLLTPFSWRNIEPSGREGFFIVNNPRGIENLKKNAAGLIDAHGNIIIDTIYKRIYPAPGGKLVIVEQAEKYSSSFGLKDYSGKTVLAVEHPYLHHMHLTRYMLVEYFHPSQADDGWNFLDASGRKMLTQNALEVKNYTDRPFRHFSIRFPEKICVYDTSLQLVAEFASVSSVEVPFGEPSLFIVGAWQGDKTVYSLRDSKGRILTSSFYDEISASFTRDPFLTGKKGGLKGVIDTAGREIVPVKYYDIWKQTIRNEPIFRGKKQNGLWTAFDRFGKERPDLGPFQSKSEDAVVGSEESHNPKKIDVVFSDGSHLPLPDSMLNWEVIGQRHTPSGGLIMFSEVNHCRNRSEIHFFNERFQNIVPPGFDTPYEFREENRPSQTTLITVFRIDPDTNSRRSVPPAPTQKPGAPPCPPTLQIRYDACGVLNTAREWVLPPKAGVRYIAMSPYIVAELPMNDKFKTSQLLRTPIKIHFLSKPGAPTLDVSYVGTKLFTQGMHSTCFGQFAGKNNTLVLAYFNEKGQQLCPFKVATGPDTLKKRNLVTIASNVDITDFTQVIIDENGKELKNLGSLVCPEIPREKTGDRNLDYFVVQEKVQAKGDKTPLQGIMDSSGVLQLELHYRQLQIIAPERLFSAADSSGKRLLYDWKGNLLYRFAGDADETAGLAPTLNFRVNSDGRLLVFNHNSTVVVSKNREVENVLPHTVFSSPKDLDASYFLSRDGADKMFWVRISDGKAFKE